MYTGTLLSMLVITRVSANSIFDLNLSGANPSYNRWKMTRDIPGLVTWPWATTYLPLLNYLFYHWGFKIIVFLSLFLLFSDVGTTLSLFCAYSKMRNVSFFQMPENHIFRRKMANFDSKMPNFNSKIPNLNSKMTKFYWKTRMNWKSPQFKIFKIQYLNLRDCLSSSKL